MPDLGKYADAVLSAYAATIVLLRDGEDVREVLMLRRQARSGYAASAWVRTSRA